MKIIIKISFSAIALFYLIVNLNSCGSCDCYFDEENIIKSDTIYKHITLNENGGVFTVQIGAFVSRENADGFAVIARSKINVDIKVKRFEDGIYRIISPDYKTLNEAQEVLQYVKSKGYSDSIIRDDKGPIIIKE
jgi:hypothetical protein